MDIGAVKYRDNPEVELTVKSLGPWRWLCALVDLLTRQSGAPGPHGCRSYVTAPLACLRG